MLLLTKKKDTNKVLTKFKNKKINLTKLSEFAENCSSEESYNLTLREQATFSFGSRPPCCPPVVVVVVIVAAAAATVSL